MTPEELRKLEKDVKKTKRLASEQAMELHDLIEDRLPDAYGKLWGLPKRPMMPVKHGMKPIKN